jgi:hypothetical protein
MKVGDLVRIQKWCKNKGRLALVVDAPVWDDSCVQILFIDGGHNPALGEQIGLFGHRAMKANLEVISHADP